MQTEDGEIEDETMIEKEEKTISNKDEKTTSEENVEKIDVDSTTNEYVNEAYDGIGDIIRPLTSLHINDWFPTTDSRPSTQHYNRRPASVNCIQLQAVDSDVTINTHDNDITMLHNHHVIIQSDTNNITVNNTVINTNDDDLIIEQF